MQNLNEEETKYQKRWNLYQVELAISILREFNVLSDEDVKKCAYNYLQRMNYKMEPQKTVVYC